MPEDTPAVDISAATVTEATDLQAAVAAPHVSDSDKVAAHKLAVDLVKQEAEFMLTSGDFATANTARRVHILASALAFILEGDFVPEPEVIPAPAPTPSPFDERITAADAAASAASAPV